jgi:hypothetical protein
MTTPNVYKRLHGFSIKASADGTYNLYRKGVLHSSGYKNFDTALAYVLELTDKF